MRVPMPIGLALAAALALGAGCGVNVNPKRQGFPCDPGGKCASGLVCVSGACVVPGDAGGGDGGASDGGLTDGGLTDGGVPDGGIPDGGPGDGGVTDGGPGDGGVPVTATVTQTIGYRGGTIQLPGASVSFPKGALGQDTRITLSELVAAPPAADGPMSPMFRVDPEGLALARPATVTLGFQGQSQDASGYWQSASATGMERVGADLVDAFGAHFGVVRLGTGFVGSISAHPTFTFYAVHSTISSPPGGATVQPTDVSTESARVIEADGTIVPGQGDAEGIVRIPGLPEGPRMVLERTTGSSPIGMVTARHVLDESRVVFAPPTSFPRASVGTSFTPTYTGLVACDLKSRCTVRSLDADIQLFTPTYRPAAGATTFTATSPENLSHHWLPGGLGRPDTLWGFEIGPTGSSGWGTRVTGAMGSVSFSPPDGQATPITVPLSTSPTATFGATVDVQQAMAAFGPAIGNTQFPTVEVTVDGLPELRGEGDLDLPVAGIDGAFQSVGPGTTMPLLDTGAAIPSQLPAQAPLQATYVDALPPSWVRIWRLKAQRSTSMAFAGSSRWVPSIVQAQGWPGPNVQIAPPVEAPTNLTLNGRSAGAPGITGVGAAPTVSWTPPPEPVAGYIVDVVHYDATYMQDLADATLLTTGPPVKLPPGLLVSGPSYRIAVYALAPALSGYHVDLGAPWQTLQWTAGIASATTQYFTP